MACVDDDQLAFARLTVQTSSARPVHAILVDKLTFQDTRYILRHDDESLSSVQFSWAGIDLVWHALEAKHVQLHAVGSSTQQLQSLPLIVPLKATTAAHSVELAVTFAQASLSRSVKPAGRPGDLVKLLAALDVTEDDAVNTFDEDNLYEYIKPTGREASYDAAIPGLSATLRAFQKRTLHWMLQQEGCPAVPQSTRAKLAAQHPEWFMPFLRVPVIDTATGAHHEVFLDRNTATVHPAANIAAQVCKPQPGGCLCEEMGLGKSVEVIAAVLGHRCPNPTPAPSRHARLDTLRRSVVPKTGAKKAGPSHPWKCAGCGGIVHGGRVGGMTYCKDCWAALSKQEVPGVAGATLIVCPHAIQDQWFAEFKRHAKHGALRVLKYTGCARKEDDTVVDLTCENPGLPTMAADFAAADVVVTTFEVLKRDVNVFTDMFSGWKEGLLSPLARLTWWRVVLDEAQMVQVTHEDTAIMARFLRMVNRWCVTGTPVSSSREDLFGIAHFLQALPWSKKRNDWQQLMAPKHGAHAGAVRNFLGFVNPSRGGMFWRTTKAAVEAELKIPKQVTVVRRLTLDPIQKHALRRAVREARDDLLATLPAAVAAAVHNGVPLLESADRPIRPAEQERVVEALERTRQACCYPEGARKAGAAKAHDTVGEPQFVTMEEHLAHLIAKDRGDAQAAVRALVAARCRRAEVARHRGLWRDQIERYHEALADMEPVHALLDVQLHSMHVLVNLEDALIATKAERAAGEDVLVSRAHVQGVAHLTPSVAALDMAESALNAAVASGPASLYERRKKNRLKRRFGDIDGLDETCDPVADTATGAAHVAPPQPHEPPDVLRRLTDWWRQTPPRLATAAARYSEMLDEMDNDEDSDDDSEDLGDTGGGDESGDELGEGDLRSLRELRRQVRMYRDVLSKAVSAGRTLPAHANPCATHAALNTLTTTLGSAAATSAAANAAKGGLCIAGDDIFRSVLGAHIKAVAACRRLAEIPRKVGAELDADAGKELTGKSRREVDAIDAGLAADEARLADNATTVLGRLRFALNLQRAKFPAAAAAAAAAAAYPDGFASAPPIAADLQVATGAEAPPAVLVKTEVNGATPLVATPLRRVKDEVDYAAEPLMPTSPPNGNQASSSAAAAALARAPLLPLQPPQSHTCSHALASALPAKGPFNNRDAAAATPALADAGECPVCCEPFGADCMLSLCGHQWCAECHNTMIAKLHTFKCPMCNTKTDPRRVTRVALVNAAAPPTVAEEAAVATTSKGAGSATAGSKVKGMWGAKVEAVVAEVLQTLARAPADKIVVFSDSAAALEVTGVALRANATPHVYGTGADGHARALAAFCGTARAAPVPAASSLPAGDANSGFAARGSPGGRAAPKRARLQAAATSAIDGEGGGIQEKAAGVPHVLLLPLTAAGAGLNLSMAQHVLLMEPSLSPAHEAQAMARVHRLNQTRETRVVRFVVDDSIEAVLHRINAGRVAAMDLANSCTAAAAADAPLRLSDVVDLLADV